MQEHDYTDQLNLLTKQARTFFDKKHSAREKALMLSRKTIQLASTAIRCSHRGNFEEARNLLDEAKVSVAEMLEIREQNPEVYFSGFIQDSQKEYVEAHTTFALICNTPLPTPEQLNISYGPYLNGLGESIGEMRRYILDSLRKGNSSRSESILDIMDQIHTELFTMDFPEAITNGLRRTTDAMRGILERTRGDLTNNVVQQSLEHRIEDIISNLDTS